MWRNERKFLGESFFNVGGVCCSCFDSDVADFVLQGDDMGNF